MYAVVEYNNYRKEQNFEIKLTTDDLDYAKKLVFNNAKKAIPKDGRTYKITSDIEEYHMWPKNECIVEYMIIEVKKCKNNKFQMEATHSTVYSVIKLKNHNYPNSESLEDIDESMICNDYYSYGDDIDDDDDDEVEDADDEAEDDK